MANDRKTTLPQARDGTSQSGRILPELDPDYAQVDERTTRDLLAFARAYARELKYFGIDDPDQAQGDWSGFIGAIDLDLAARYVDQPDRFSLDAASPYARPHFALFLTFLKLLESARAQLNTFTYRHLEFFYRDVLRMTRKRAVPDHVHVLVELDGRTETVQLPPGTALRAGKDRLGRDLHYRTRNELIANQVQVAQVSSLHTEIRHTGIREASRQYLLRGTPEEAFVAMLRIAIGQPNPGDPLPVPIYPGVPPAQADPQQPPPEVSFEVLVRVSKLIGVVETGLGMPIFDNFRDLMKRRRLRQDNEAADWRRINTFLTLAGQMRDPGFKIVPMDSSDFNANLEAALNKTLAKLFDGLPEVDTVEEAYAAYCNRPGEVEAFLRTALSPLNLADFKAMMDIKVGVLDGQWEEINRLLEEAGKCKRDDRTFKLKDDVRASHDFDDKLDAAVANFDPKFTFPGGLDAYFEAFLAVESYFYMPAENFRFIMGIAARPSPQVADDLDWERVYEIVTAAHQKMIYARRRAALTEIAQPAINAKDGVRALSDMLVMVLGLNEAVSLEDALQRLAALGLTELDLQDLKKIANPWDPTTDWNRVYQMLEIAQRNRESFKEPVAEKVEWRNLYPAVDARAVLVQSAQADAQPLLHWKTFGRGEQRRAELPVPAPVIGWAMTSALLWLSEGERSIELTLGFRSDAQSFDLEKIRSLLAPAGVATFNPFQVALSTAKGWLEAAAVELSWTLPDMAYPQQQGVDGAELRALVFRFALSKSQPPLASPTLAVHGIDTPFPALRLMLRPIWKGEDCCYVTSYQLLRKLLLIRTHLAVKVKGLTGLCIRNDQTILDVKKPFEPFGTYPASGSRFYLGHPEIVGKKLDWISFNLTWMGVPEKLDTHYANYLAPVEKGKPHPLGNAMFAAKVSLADGKVLKDFPEALTLFNANDATQLVGDALSAPADQGNPEDLVAASPDVAEWNRYLLWELGTPDFQHAVYPTVALQHSLAMAVAIANKDPETLAPEKYQVNPPYTPKIKSLTVDYGASADLVLDPVVSDLAAMHVFHIEPFGYAELKAEGAQPGCPFLPQYDCEGELYIGLRNVQAQQKVSLLFQVAEGSANPDVTPEPVQWSYLSNNHWLTLHDGSLLADATRGLINSGIVRLSLKPALPSTRLPSGLYWIRATIVRSSDCVCDIVDIHPNAVLAAFVDDHNAPEHLGEPLPAGRIVGPVTLLPGVAHIRQPYSSFGGKMAEQDASFNVRVSERLRHKQRALTVWDYERLVLEKFPQLYKVKCLRADPTAHPHDPGRIELIVIPDIRNRLPFNPFEPKAPVDLLRDIEAFLADKTSPVASLQARNAHYVPVRVRCGVRFLPGTDEGYCRKRLNEELNRFLSPWAYEEGAEIVIGGSIYANSIINFLDGRDYVDYIAEFALFTSEDAGENFAVVPPDDGYHVGAKRPDGVLVAAREHEFVVIAQADYRFERFTGINYMRIELDFIVA